MALATATNFKASVATAAAALTTAWKDTVKTEVAANIAHPSNPLRKIEKLFSFDPATGVISANNTYIDACYAGTIPQVKNPFDVIATTT